MYTIQVSSRDRAEKILRSGVQLVNEQVTNGSVWISEAGSRASKRPVAMDPSAS